MRVVFTGRHTGTTVRRATAARIVSAVELSGGGAEAPYIAYTDIVAGPASGGEGGNGAYLTIFGTGFGADIGAITVTVNNTTAAQKIYLGASRASDGHRTIQALGVQIASGTTSGAIKVTVGGVDSNTDHTFTVQSGSMFYVATTGSSGNPGTFASPKDPGFLADYAPSAGTFVVIRGGTYNSGFNSTYGVFLHNASGSSSGWVTFVGYPGEDVSIVSTGSHATDSSFRIFNAGGLVEYVAIANLLGDISGGTTRGGSFGLHDNVSNIRLVNCRATGMYQDGGGSAAVAGSGSNVKLLGNLVDTNDGSKLYHAFYWDGRAPTNPTNIEIAYNKIFSQKGGRGIQIYGDTARTISDVNVHHNWIESIHLDGILFSRQNGTNCKAWCNVITNCGDATLVHPTADDGAGGAGIRLTDVGDANTLEVELYHNTLALNNVDTLSGEISFEAYVQCVIRNNLIYTAGAYTAGSDTTTRTSSNNLWNGNGAAPGFDTDSRSGSPNFVNLGAKNFDLAAGSDAIGNGHNLSGASFTPDRDFLLRPFNATRDIGAFAYQG